MIRGRYASKVYTVLKQIMNEYKGRKKERKKRQIDGEDTNRVHTPTGPRPRQHLHIEAQAGHG